MTICSSERRGCDAWCAALGAVLISVALPLAVPTAAHAQRNGPPQMQHGPTAAPAQQSPRAMDGQRGAQSQASLRSEFRTALEPHGRWQHHARFGDVWIPANRARDWRPYTAGRWAYTNDWGWYWESDDAEARWGWIAYHYGRWALDDELGWCWVPGEEWSPAWVQWRRPRGDVEYVGWAPLPPDEVVVEYVDQPRFWIFVRGRDFIAPRLASVILPVARHDVFFRETVVVNRTMLVSERERFAVNPGISPTFIAAATRQPLRTYSVQPTVLAGTAPLQGAMQVRAQDLRRGDFRPRAALQPTQSTVRAADRVAPAQPLAAGERGRLGDQPPRAAQQRGPQTPSTTGQAPDSRQQAQPQSQPSQRQPPLQAQPGQPQQQAEPKLQQRATEGRSATEQRQQQAQPKQAEPKQQQREQRTVQPQRPANEGRAATEQRQQRPATEGRGSAERRQAAPNEGRAASPAPQRAAPQVERSAPAPQRGPATTEGRGGAGGAPHASPAPRMQGGGGATEGRGGGGAAAPQRAPGGGGTGGGHGGPGGPR
jgi:hypothetical protein